MQALQERALTGLAVGRIGLGVLARFAPATTTRLFGATPTPELDYMNRIFGVRAFALGSGYLLSSGDARRLWQRLAFVCDLSDTVTGVGMLRRREVGRGTAILATALTGSYMAVGATRVLTDSRA